MSKLIFGVGFNSKVSSGFKSKTKHQAFVGGKSTTAYYKWHSMIERCYCPKRLKRNPNYIGCTVADEWHDFQVFAEWFYGHKYAESGYDLDKDILVVNNKEYNSATCCFVPQEINKLLTDRMLARGSYPQGVTLKKETGRFCSQININGSRIHLGYFSCPNEAHQVYKKEKEAYVKVKALEWQDRIADNVFQALMNWAL